MARIVIRAWRALPEDVRNAAVLLPTVAAIYAAIYPFCSHVTR